MYVCVWMLHHWWLMTHLVSHEWVVCEVLVLGVFVCVCVLLCKCVLSVRVIVVKESEGSEN